MPPDPNSQDSEAILEMVDADVPSMKGPGRIVLEQVNWLVKPGDYWFVAGLHWSGKTDLLGVASGLMPPHRGTCRLFGQPTRGQSEGEIRAARMRVGMVFEDGHLLHHLTVAGNASLPVRYHRNVTLGEAMTEIEPLLELMELLPWREAAPDRLSRNVRQRVGLARALTLKPELLLLDNPLFGLDPQESAWWLGMLERLSLGHPWLEGKPLTVIVTGDSFRPWRGYAKRCALLRNRRFHTLREHPGDEAPDLSLLNPSLPLPSETTPH